MRNAQVLRERHWVCARRLSERRRELGLTQCDVVDRLSALGVEATNRTLSSIEHGQGLDIGRLPELAIALDCTVTYLLGMTANPSKWEPDDHNAEVAIAVTAPGRLSRPGPAPSVNGAGGPAAANGSGGAGAHRDTGPGPASWILGPDVPERRISPTTPHA